MANPDNPFYTLPAQLNPAGMHWVGLGLAAAVSKRSEDGKFKVPILRNIERSTPYMHNGCFRTLRGRWCSTTIVTRSRRAARIG
jgi:cytochrome c peroxidase